MCYEIDQKSQEKEKSTTGKWICRVFMDEVLVATVDDGSSKVEAKIRAAEVAYTALTVKPHARL